ncbi:NTP transferase domain-containing protein [Shewanella sp. FJAT-52076]|uniref:phosphocholine cytidylyltransferase family protein n=1 Tax=Shewanella sp. FJAT-52076 TaxID=2864202 RepID=UPI001C658B86|nr:phosphocholine cytidylyltransferase family protein [Shewanella sp. FJAT-52076]QYJ74137.1 phosphocholine cytidylyltransferase family protein [Shewanella sp. FJAT-52076]
MQGVILAAGRGSRLGQLTSTQPKGLTPVLGKPMLSMQLDAMKRAGIDKVAAATGYLAEQVQAWVSISFTNARWSETNMVSSLLACAPFICEDETIISYSDIVYPTSAIESLMTASSDIAILYDPNWLSQWQQRFDNPLSDAETFRLTDGRRLVDIGRRPEHLDEVQGQYMGLLKFTPRGFGVIQSLLAALPQAEVDKLDMTSLLRRLLATGEQIEAVPFDGFWFEVDSETDLIECERQLKAKGGLEALLV